MQPSKPSGTSKQSITCPNCGNPIGENWQLCPKCGFDLTPSKIGKTIKVEGSSEISRTKPGIKKNSLKKQVDKSFSKKSSLSKLIRGVSSIFISLILIYLIIGVLPKLSLKQSQASTQMALTLRTPTGTPTKIPTKTPTPTSTKTITPTATVPAPDKTLEYLNGVRVGYVDTFDYWVTSVGWDLFDAGKIEDGKLKITGNNWNGIVRKRDFKDNQGIVIDFTYNRGSVFEMFVDSGDWYTNPYKRFGLYVEKNYARANIWAGKNGLGGARLAGNLILKPDTTYSMLIALLPGADFLGVIWDPSDPSKSIIYHEKIGKNWTNLTWKFKMGADSGTILFDNYREITFDRVK